jgi:processive 1,2-diacylglycerol beta-glucosyltransferase
MDLTTRMPQNPVVHELMATGFANAEAYVKAFKPDAVISTHPVPGGVVTEFKRSLGLLAATVVTDYSARRLWLHPDTDLYFVATKELRDEIVVRGIPYDRVVVSGNPIDESFAAPGTSETARASLGLADRFTVLLAPTGGPADGMRSLARALAGAGIQVVAVAGRDERSQQALQRLGEKHPLLHAFGPATEMSALMRAADLVVGGSGGPTCSQAFALGAPVIVYDPGPGQETHDAGFVVMWGAGLEAGTEEGVVEIVRFLSTHPERLSQLASNAAELGRPSAARAVCERVLAGLR